MSLSALAAATFDCTCVLRTGAFPGPRSIGGYRHRMDGYWFRAKRYGWGWGLPDRWQGWVVLLAYAAAMMAMARFLPSRVSPLLFFGLLVVVTVLFGLVVWKTGEPPRWRGGKN